MIDGGTSGVARREWPTVPAPPPAGWGDPVATQVPAPAGTGGGGRPGGGPGRPAVVALAVAGLVVLGLLVTTLTDARRDATGSVVRSGTIDAFALRAGDCYEHPQNDQFTRVEVVPCADPHDAEVFFVFDLPAGPLPGEGDRLTAVERSCVPMFARYVGEPLERTDLDIVWLEPTADSWGEGDREVLCALVKLDGSKLVGSRRSGP